MIITSLIFFSYHLNKWTIGHADYVFTVSNALVTKIKKDYKKDTINYTPSGVENDFPIPQGVEKKYLGVFIGRMTMEKGIFEVLHTWADVMKQLPQAQLALAGYADTTMKKTLETEIEKLGLKQHITYFGDVTEEKKKELLSQSHLFLHLARLEPLFPVITILEGFSFGLPAILYDMPVLQETVKELDLPTNCMYTVENGSAVKAAESIVLYTKLSKEEQSQLQRNAKAFADKFDWNTIAHKEFSVISRFVQHVE
jgi:glycosyltransferase involved in cell wall biosynthesis